MKIVILDGHTANPGDLSWKAISDLGDLQVFEQTEDDEIIQRAYAADIIITNKAKLSKNHFPQLPNLKCICLLATGYDNINIQDATRFGIKVYNAVGYSSASVAQHVFSMLLYLTNRVDLNVQSVKRGEWYDEKWSYSKSPMTELCEKTIGLIGFGKIAQRVAQIALAFGMEVLVYSRTKKEDLNPQLHWVSKDQILLHSDIISLHLPLTDETRFFIGRDELGKMRASSILVNTARGGLIDESALAEALNSKQIAWALLDVISEEPPSRKNILFDLENCLITPHQAWATKECRTRLINITASNIKSFTQRDFQNSLS